MELERDNLGGRIDRWMSGGLFAAIFCYVWLIIQPDLIFFTFGTYSPSPSFEPGWAFSRVQLSQTGGLVSYIGGFLSQTFVVSWLGAVVIVLVVWLLYGSIGAIPGLWSPTIRRFAGFGLSVGVVMIWQQYDHPMNLALGLTINLVTAGMAMRFESRRAAVRIAVFAALIMVLYWWTGAICLVFGIVLVLKTTVGKGRIREGLACMALGTAAMWILGRWMFCLEPWEIWKVKLPIHPAIRAEMKSQSRIWAKAMVIAVGVLFLSDLLIERWFRRRIPTTVHSRHVKAETGVRYWTRVTLKRGLYWIILISLSAWGLEYSRRANLANDTHPLNLQAGLAARNGQWRQVVTLGETFKRKGLFNTTLIHDTDRALYHLGQLGDRMFEFPQSVHALLFYTVEGLPETLRFDKISGLMLDLGSYNPAEHYATEVLELEGNCPFILDRLAAIAWAKGQKQAAMVFEAALSRQPAHGLQSRLGSGIGKTQTPEANESRARPAEASQGLDHEVRESTPEDLLLDLLVGNPENRMAFEYLMAYYLITLQQEKAVGQFYRLKDLGFQRLPRHYAEAAMIALSKTRGQIDLKGWTIDPAVVKQYQAFTARVKALRTDPGHTATTLAGEFGNSYFFYGAFNLSGVGQ